jgi:hypothetical protein
MYLKLKLIEFGTIIYVKVIEETKKGWMIHVQPKLYLINKQKMGTRVRNKRDIINFKKGLDYTSFGYTILGTINDFKGINVDDNHIYE